MSPPRTRVKYARTDSPSVVDWVRSEAKPTSSASVDSGSVVVVSVIAILRSQTVDGAGAPSISDEWPVVISSTT